jgi:hypothetical protein
MYSGKCIPMRGGSLLLGLNGVAATSAAPNPGDQGAPYRGSQPETPTMPLTPAGVAGLTQGGALSKKIAAKLDGLKAQRAAGGYSSSKPKNIRFSL